MLPKRVLHIILIFFTFFPVSPILAENKVYLTHNNVEAFIESFPEVREWNKKESKTLNRKNDTYNQSMNFLFKNQQTPFEAILYSAHDPYIRQQLDKLVQKYGFYNIDEWIDVGDRISNTYLAIQGTFNREDGKNELNRTSQAIQRDKEMPTGYQDIMLGIIDEAQNAVEEMDEIEPAEMDLVKQRIPELATMFTP